MVAKNGKASKVGGSGSLPKRGRKPGAPKWPFTVRMTRQQITWLEQHYGWVQAGLAALIQGAMAAAEGVGSGRPSTKRAKK